MNHVAVVEIHEYEDSPVWFVSFLHQDGKEKVYSQREQDSYKKLLIKVNRALPNILLSEIQTFFDGTAMVFVPVDKN